MAKILVSLVSEQTIPNVELIKEFQSEIDKFVFITTKQMIKQLQWIISSTQITNFDTIEVDPFNPTDIEKKLNDHDFGDDEIVVNITGGTKLTLIIVNDFFRTIGATIYYVTGHEKKYIKVFPNRGKRDFELNRELSLNEYLTAYGFTYKENLPFKDYEQAKRLFVFFLKENTQNLKDITEPIRLRRDKCMELSKFETSINFLTSINYTFEKNTLNKKDTKYLSGDWLEEFIYFSIKNELNLKETEIATGINLSKENNPNEIDVIFIYKHKLHIVECKTSVIDKRKIKVVRNGIEYEEEKDFKILGETIYKSDALSRKFGLFANTTILTLEEIKLPDSSPVEEYKALFDRANLSKVNIISKQDLMSGKSFKELLQIK